MRLASGDSWTVGSERNLIADCTISALSSAIAPKVASSLEPTRFTPK